MAKEFVLEDHLDAMNNQCDLVTDAFFALKMCERDVQAVVEFLSDNMLIKGKIQKFGATKNAIALFNDKENTLNECAGLENFSIETLEGLSAQARADYTKKYINGLNSNIETGLEEFKERLKIWVNRFNTAFKSMLVSQAKMLKLVQQCDFSKVDLNDEINGVDYKTAKAILDEMKRISRIATDASKVAADLKAKGMNAIVGKAKMFLDSIVIERKKISEMGWTSENIQKTVKEFSDYAYNKTLFNICQQYAKTVDDYSRQAAKTVGDSAGAQFADGWKVGAAFAHSMKVYRKCTEILAKTLYRMSLATQAPDNSAQQTSAAPAATPSTQA